MQILLSKKLQVFLFLCSLMILRMIISAQAQTDSAEPDLNIPDVLNARGDPMVVITRIVKYVLGLVGLIAVIMIIYGGLVWMTSGGNTEKIKKGKDTLVWAVFGLALIFFAYAIINFILKIFVSAG